MKKGRPKKVRYIQKMPKISQFSPRGKPGRPDECLLSFDEFEAIRLADFQGKEHVQGAQAMGISRPSFGRILKRARKILADALINGKTIKIGLGDAQVGVRPLDKFSPKMKEVIGEVLPKKSRPRKPSRSKSSRINTQKVESK